MNQIALIKCELIVGVFPGDRIDFFDLHFAVKVNEASLARLMVATPVSCGVIVSLSLRIRLADVSGNTRYVAEPTIVPIKRTYKATVLYVTVCQYTSTREIFGFAPADWFAIAHVDLGLITKSSIGV